jgi:cell division protein FtsZ
VFTFPTDGDELVLDSDDILTSPVMANPIAPPADEDDATLHGNPGTDEPRAPRESGTLFERMSNIARGSAQARADEDEAAPGFRREPIDIPGFLNRQNNR